MQVMGEPEDELHLLPMFWEVALSKLLSEFKHTEKMDRPPIELREVVHWHLAR